MPRTRKVPYLRKCSGLYTKVDPLQVLNRDNEQPSDSPIASCLNVIISDTGKVEVSNGHRTLFSLTDGHSLFCDGGDCLVHDGGSMYQVLSGLTLSAAKRTGMSGDYVDHAQQPGGYIYFSNENEHGIFGSGVAIAWDAEDYDGPPTDKQFESTVPYFSHIATHNGFMLGAIENVLFCSILGQFGVWWLKPVWATSTDIIMLNSVDTGVFISDRNRQVFMAGENPWAWETTPKSENIVANYPAVEWAKNHSKIDLSTFSGSSGFGRAWLSEMGQCIGLPTGQMVNETQLAVDIPKGVGTAGACLVHGTNMISTLR